MPRFTTSPWLRIHSGFSMLRGTDTPERMVQRAAELGYRTLALTDCGGVFGAVRFHRAAVAAGLTPVLGVEMPLEDLGRIVLLALSCEGWGGLCRMLSGAAARGPRQAQSLSWEDLSRERKDLVALSGGRCGIIDRCLLRGDLKEALRVAKRLKQLFGRRFLLEIHRDGLPGGPFMERRTGELASSLGIRQMAGSDVFYARPEDFWVHDLLICARHKIDVETLHPERPLNDQGYLKSPQDMSERFADRKDLLDVAAGLSELAAPSLDLSVKRFPVPPTGGAPCEEVLRVMVREGALRRYGKISQGLKERLDHELGVIEALGFSGYFLLVADVVRFARQEGIRVAGRGSAADSAVAYCLGLTEVDAFSQKLLFERFMSRERAERPDIDLDFDSRHRDRVADYVARRYGAEKTAAVGTFQTFQARSAVRDMGAALGMPEADITALARKMPSMPADAIERRFSDFPELARSSISRERFSLLLRACRHVAGLPRFLGTHLGGVVVSSEPIEKVSPRLVAAKGVWVVPFDKEDVEALGLVKLDLLSLRTFAVLDESLKGLPARAAHPPFDDGATFSMLQKGETIGVFQLESPAQRALQPKLQPRSLKDIVEALAIIRPGPIKGDMVRPYLERRAGREPVTYLHPKLEPILEKTYGVVLFQEQVIEIARVIAGFSAGEADRIRRVMTHARTEREMQAIGAHFTAKAQEMGVSGEVAEKIFSMLSGYASYGFPEAHAAAFSLTAWHTAYLTCHHPAHFFAGLLSQQPMGHYPPHTLVTEARRRGVALLPLDINKSETLFTARPGAMRVGFCGVRGLGAGAEAIFKARRTGGPFVSLKDLRRRVNLKRDQLEALVLAGALDSLEPNRRKLLQALALPAEGLFDILPKTGDFPPLERFFRQQAVLPLKGPAVLMELLRPRLQGKGIPSCEEAHERRGPIRLVGFPLLPHRPPTRSGRTIAYFSLEDETGLVDVTVFEKVYQKYGQFLFDRSRTGPLWVEGRIEEKEGARSLIASALGPFRITRSGL